MYLLFPSYPVLTGTVVNKALHGQSHLRDDA